MISVSDSFKTAMKNPIKELDAYLLLSDNTKITSADDLISFKISCETSLCKTAMKKVECKYLGTHNLLGEWVHFVFGVKISDGTFEYLDYGAFQVNEITTSKDTGITTIVAYDKMIKSMIEYKPLNITYPTILYDFTKSLVEDCGLELKNTSFNANSDFPISQELFSNIQGITYRDIFTQIAEATASTCIISEDKVYFKPILETNEELTYDNMFTLKLENKYGEINSVVLARTPQEDNIYLKDDESIELNGLTEFKIENNDIVDKNREIAIIDIFNQLNGISYYPFETSTEGLGWYEIGDKITIINDNEEEFDIVLFNLCINIDGSIKEILKTSEPSKTRSQYQYATSIDKKVKNTELIVDKQNGEIKGIIKEIGDRTSKTTSITQDLDSISESVSLQQNLTNIVKETSYVDVDDAYEGNLLYLSIYGQMSLLYPEDNLYPEDTLYPLDSYLIIQNSAGDETKVKLPINWLNYMNENIYDEFILEKNKAKIIRRVGINSDGSKYALENETVENYGDLVIPISTGYNKLWLESFYDLELNYKIKYVIKSDYTDTFATEVYVDNSIDISEKGVLLQSKQYTDNKAEDLSSEIQLHAGEIVLKVDANGKIVKAALTADAEQGTLFEIDADQVNLTANDILNLIAGNEINLTSKNLSINSTNFSVDKDGKVQAKDMTILGGDINLHSQELLSKIKITDTDNEDCYFTMNARVWNWFGANGGTINFTNTLSIPIISLSDKEESDTEITSQWVKTPIVNQTSLKEHKKNFEKYAGALEEIKNIDIYKYNLRSEEDGSKKHLGFVIGDGFNYSKTVTSQDNTGVDIYSMTSLCLQAIKEQQEEIEKLKEEINSLKKGGK